MHPNTSVLALGDRATGTKVFNATEAPGAYASQVQSRVLPGTVARPNPEAPRGQNPRRAAPWLYSCQAKGLSASSDRRREWCPKTQQLQGTWPGLALLVFFQLWRDGIQVHIHDIFCRETQKS